MAIQPPSEGSRPEFWSRRPIRTVTLALLAVGLVGFSWTWGAMRPSDGALRTARSAATGDPVAPMGIVSFELAWSGKQARTIVDAWRRPVPAEATKTLAGVGCFDGTLEPCALENLDLDRRLIAFYVLLLTAACLRLLGPAGPTRRRVFRLAAPLPAIAGLLDVAENRFLLELLGAGSLDPEAATLLARGAALAAGAKFGLLAIVGLVLVTSLARRLAPRLRRAAG